MISPNPASEFLFIEDKSNHNRLENMRIFNSNGQLVLASDLESGMNSIDISGLPSGIYIAILGTDSGHQFSSKIIKME